MRAAQKLVDLALAQRVPVVVTLALNGDPLTGCSPRDQIHAHVAAIQAGQRFALGPIGPAPDLVDLKFGLLKREPHEQLLEPAALLGLVAALVADAVEDLARAWPAREIEAGLSWPSQQRLRKGLEFQHVVNRLILRHDAGRHHVTASTPLRSCQVLRGRRTVFSPG